MPRRAMRIRESRGFGSSGDSRRPVRKATRSSTDWLAAKVIGIDAEARARRERAQAAQVIAGKRELGDYDVFLCYHLADKPAVRQIAERLCERGLLPWMDERDLQPGRSVLDQIQEQLGQIKSAAVFVGPAGMGPWQQKETKALLAQFADADRQVIPVLLPGAGVPKDLPVFLREYHAVDLATTDPDPIDQLEWGITGTRRR